MYYSVDRIEAEFAVCERNDDMKIVKIPIDVLPDNIKEGSIIIEVNGEYLIDANKENEIRQKNIKLQNSLFE